MYAEPFAGVNLRTRTPPPQKITEAAAGAQAGGPTPPFTRCTNVPPSRKCSPLGMVGHRKSGPQSSNLGLQAWAQPLCGADKRGGACAFQPVSPGVTGSVWLPGFRTPTLKGKGWGRGGGGMDLGPPRR